MTKQQSKPLKSKGIKQFLSFLLIAALAFATAFVFRRSSGVLAMTPIALLLCAASAFVKYDLVTKIVMYGAAVFMLNTIENENIGATITFTALCLLAVVAFNKGIPALKEERRKGISIIAICSVFFIVASLIFIGNPIKAMKEGKKLDDYVEANYPKDQNSVLGSFNTSKVYYNYETKAYSVDVVSDKFPTEGASVSANGEAITDDLYSLMLTKAGDAYIAEMSALLRDRFPDASFEVRFDGFASLPDQKLLFAGEGELYDNVYYEIFIGGVQTAQGMRENVADYIDAIEKSNYKYAKITFKSGIGTWIQRSVTVDPNHPFYHNESEVNYVGVFLTNRFSSYLREALIDN